MNQLPDRPDPNEKPRGYDYPITGRDVFSVVIITLLILFAGFIVIAALGTMEVVSTEGNIDTETIDQWTSGNLDTLPTSLKVAAMLTQLLLIVPVIVYIRRKNLSAATIMRFRPVPWSLVFPSILIGLGVAVIGDEISRLIDFVLPLPEEMAEGIQRMMQLNSVTDFITMGLTVAVIAPVVEELLFRGFFQRFFEAKRGVTSGVMLASALFAAYHFNIYWLIPILLMATVMGAMAWRAESVIPSIIVHATNNSLGVLAANMYPGHEPSWFTMGDHVHPLLLLFALIITVWGLRFFFRLAETHNLGGHSPSGGAGTHVDTEA